MLYEVITDDLHARRLRAESRGIRERPERTGTCEHAACVGVIRGGGSAEDLQHPPAAEPDERGREHALSYNFV